MTLSLPKKKKARPGYTYRGARRNEARTTGAVMLRRGPEARGSAYRGSIQLNRSRKWARAKSHANAREIGPSSEPVR